MHLISHILLFLLSAAVVWGLSGMLVNATERVARRYERPGFGVAFFVLGIMTSISELSVAANATLAGVPQISAGNLIGGSLVIFLLIIPLLATLGGGLTIHRILTRKNMMLSLLLVGLPSIVILDGNLNRLEGVLMVLLYVTVLYVIEKRKPAEETATKAVQEVEKELLHTRHATLIDVLKIGFAAALIFGAARILVDESVFFSRALSVPPSIIGLVILSIGTNVPELTIAVRCVLGRRHDIAFGDYMGSAAANTLIMGFLGIANGSFEVVRGEFVVTFLLMSIGLTLFYLFSRSRNDISRQEGFALLGMYAAFCLSQAANIIGR